MGNVTKLTLSEELENYLNSCLEVEDIVFKVITGRRPRIQILINDVEISWGGNDHDVEHGESPYAVALTKNFPQDEATCLIIGQYDSGFYVCNEGDNQFAADNLLPFRSFGEAMHAAFHRLDNPEKGDRYKIIPEPVLKAKIANKVLKPSHVTKLPLKTKENLGEPIQMSASRTDEGININLTVNVNMK